MRTSLYLLKIAILDSAGTAVVEYKYDAWGNHSVSGSNTTLGNKNPFRYRGYYYDTETGLYYLQTRYYDPKIGRFINMDSIDYADPTYLNGLNLYAYCNNNPVIGYDPDGTWNWGKVRDVFSTIVGFFNPISKLTAIGAVVVAACQGRWEDLKTDWDNGCFNPFNQDAGVALNSKVFSFYKGESVIRHSVKGTTSGQLFGTIMLNSSVKNDDKGITTLNHEYGHGIQEKLFPGYLFRIGIPSLITYFKGLKDSPYFSMPWERTADYFGGVNRSTGYKTNSLGWAFAENILGPIVIPFYFMFGY